MLIGLGTGGVLDRYALQARRNADDASRLAARFAAMISSSAESERHVLTVTMNLIAAARLSSAVLRFRSKIMNGPFA